MANQKLQNSFLDNHVFYGLTNLNDGFDVPSIKYFSQEDFEIVLDRVEKNELGIYGIEPWLDGEFYDVTTCGDFNKKSTDPEWYRSALDKFKKTELNLQYAASYYIPASEREEE